MSDSAIGAMITYTWNLTDNLTDEDKQEGYVSFGEYIEASNCDSYGADDDNIFFYSSQQELVEMLTNKTTEWKLLSIDGFIYH
jgi:hypothetical protein